MKKVITLIMSLFLVLGLSGCSNDSQDESSNSSTNENNTHNTDTTTIDGKILVVYYSATGNIEDARNIELVSATVENWDEYDRVFIGYPLWWQYCLASK